MDCPEDSALAEKLSDWISRQGYALEYQTHRALSARNLNPLLSRHIENSDGVWREIDVCAEFLQETPGDSPIAARICCECKYSKDKPWVLMESGAACINSRCWTCLPHSDAFDAERFADQLQSEHSYLETTVHFQKSQHWAHSLVQAFREKKDNRDDAFDALRKISDAAWDWANEWTRQGYKSLVVVIPCIVVDGPLYRAVFDDAAGRFDVQQIPFGRLLWSGCRGGTLIDIVQSASLNDYALDAGTTMQTVLNILSRIRSKGLLYDSIAIG